MRTSFHKRVSKKIAVFWLVASRNSIDTFPDVEKNFYFRLQSAVKNKQSFSLPKR